MTQRPDHDHLDARITHELRIAVEIARRKHARAAGLPTDDDLADLEEWQAPYPAPEPDDQNLLKK
jgi:hypothetical protein